MTIGTLPYEIFDSKIAAKFQPRVVSCRIYRGRLTPVCNSVLHYLPCRQSARFIQIQDKKDLLSVKVSLGKAIMEQTVSFTLNGDRVEVTTDGERMLLWVLRGDLDLTGAHFGCGVGLCGACTVVVENEAVRSCVTPLQSVEGKHVLTIEGIGRDGLHAVQQAFISHHAFQCGYCTSGMIMNAYALLRKTPHPTREQIARHMEDNLCRCGTHGRILDAIQEAAGAAKAGA